MHHHSTEIDWNITSHYNLLYVTCVDKDKLQISGNDTNITIQTEKNTFKMKQKLCFLGDNFMYIMMTRTSNHDGHYNVFKIASIDQILT